MLKKYLIKKDNLEFATLYDYFKKYIIEEKKYYWLNQCRVSSSEWEEYDGYNHWYEILELYSAEKELPFDMNDEEIVTIFGFDEFEDFADLSYGC